MDYLEFEQYYQEERREILSTMDQDEKEDLFDQRPFEMQGFTNSNPSRIYYDTIEELHEKLLTMVPAAKPWQAGEAAEHELAHAECALALGALGVKYYVYPEIDMTTRSMVFTHVYGPATLPNLAWAAISMHPYAAARSIPDMRNIKSYGYESREQIILRIKAWNKNGHDLHIPEPQTWPKLYNPG